MDLEDLTGTLSWLVGPTTVRLVLLEYSRCQWYGLGEPGDEDEDDDDG